MKDRVATHNTLHAALYTPDKHCTTGFKQLVKMTLSGFCRRKASLLQEMATSVKEQKQPSLDRQELSCYNNNRNIYELKM